MSPHLLSASALAIAVVFFILGHAYAALGQLPERTACASLGTETRRELLQTDMGYIQHEWTRPKCFDRPASPSIRAGGAHE